MNWIKRVMERGRPPAAAPYATTPNGAPFPLRSWPPDAAIDIQNLATWADLLKPETVRRFADTAARTAAIPTPAEGMTSTLNSADALERHNGTAWLPLTGKAIAGGQSGPTDASGNATVTFPAGRFTAAPVVVATVGPGGTTGWVFINALSATGFTGHVEYGTGHTTAAGFVFQWIAIQF